MATANFPEELGQRFKNSLTNVSPYEVPAIMWGFIEKYFVERYKLKLTKTRPQTQVEGPVIAWRIFRRVPGAGKDKVLNARGPNYSHTESVDRAGFVNTIHTQHHTVYYEFTVYGTSNEEADHIAWDLENALYQVIGLMQEAVPGFHMSFDQQLSDSDLSWKAQDDLMVRSMRWEAVVPVRYTELVEELRRVHVDLQLGSVTQRAIKFIRTSSSTRFDIPVESGYTLLKIHEITLGNNTGLKTLVLNVDYEVLNDDVTKIPYISWNDDYGLTPIVNQEFRVDYEVGKSPERLTLIR